ncbi:MULTISPECIES: DUF411 domain-containing protein [Methylomonas]|uniref:DUF411 domain-containing protein n=1 Tax=Methylomonas TaxID=416 RepID=UPI0012323B08|nr:DUF411 domain-containing protein [Methylomonas rhizoryzae]
MKRLSQLIVLLGAAGLAQTAYSDETVTEMTVYRSPTCGCCGKWIEHVSKNGFKVKDIVSDDMQAIKQKLGLPEQLASCHTAVVDGYLVEGHVPAADIRKMLNEKTKIAGISAPGMPMGSPGMEMGGKQDDYEVVSYDSAGNTQVFADHKAGQ